MRSEDCRTVRKNLKAQIRACRFPFQIREVLNKNLDPFHNDSLIQNCFFKKVSELRGAASLEDFEILALENLQEDLEEERDIKRKWAGKGCRRTKLHAKEEEIAKVERVKRVKEDPAEEDSTREDLRAFNFDKKGVERALRRSA